MARLTLHGIGAAPGVGIGRAHLYAPDAPDMAPAGPEGALPETARPAERARWSRALEEAAAQLAAVQTSVAQRAGDDQAAVFEAQALFLQDPALLEPVEAAIRDDGTQAPVALERVWEAAARELEAIDDPYLRARAADLRDVARLLLRLLAGAGATAAPEMGPDSIVVARDLTPGDIAQVGTVRGIVLAEGTPTAHAAILARGMGIPLVVGVGEAIRQIGVGQPIILDGANGTALVDPDGEERARYERHVRTARQGSATREESERATVTLDGRRIALLANAGSAADARRARELGAEGIGLLRTEFLIAGLPVAGSARQDEDALALAYGAVMQAMGDRPIVVRALDAGGDKPVPFLDAGHEANPALGWRGIRVLLARPDLFIAQTRALLRAATRHTADVRLLLPMVSTLDELREARRLIEAARASMGAGTAALPIGAMIEVPAAALIADALAREADFFSLGTNDLVQYTLACDRGNARVQELYQPRHPAVLRLIDMVVRAAHAAGRTVSVCGEAAGDPATAPVLIGLGVDALSVAPDQLAAMRARIRELRFAQTRERAVEALSGRDHLP